LHSTSLLIPPVPLSQVILKTRRAQPFFSRHPWVFAGAIERVDGEPADGAEVEVRSGANNFVARGLFNSQSKIRVRLYSWEPERALDREFFRERLAKAIHFRQAIGLRGPDKGCRLVFSESDGVSGCTIDEYSGWLAVQVTALAIAQRREMLAELLDELIKPRGIYLRTEKGVGRLEGLELHDGVLRGASPPPDLTIEENGLHFLVNLAEGQKTGYYLDQRDNRVAAARFGRERTVLDAFSGTGGFGLYAARAGASRVECVDASEPALNLARANAARNGLANVEFVRADVFDHLLVRVNEGRRYGMVVLDPPKFARSRSSIPEALRGYRRLQTLALRLLEADGILVTCCCSGLITPEMLEELLAQIAAHERRDLQILAKSGQAPDHPVAVSCLETAYLKCFISRVI
jgi:23S rRNA (cytosine1962-C5)-methyltransferase